MVSRHKKIKKNVFVSDSGSLTAVVSWQFYPNCPLVLCRKIAALPPFTEIVATEPLKYVDTRYGNRGLMGRCLLTTRDIYRNLMVDTEMEE